LDAECECDPLSETACDQPTSNLKCSTTFYVDELGAIIGMPALDGSEGAWATECVSDFVQEDGAGASCFVTAGSGSDGSAPTRRDTCVQGFHCENPDGGEQGTCVPLCASSADCGGGTCALFDTGATGVTLGRCL
jgi:hypothetical protein